MNQPRILIVEDDPMQAEHIAKKIISFGYKVSDQVRTESEAKSSLAKNRVDLAILDIALFDNETGGIEVGKHINKHYKIPFIYLTGQNNEALEKEAKMTRYTSFLDKPFSEKQLKRAISDALWPPGIETDIISLERPSSQIDFLEGREWCWIRDNNLFHKVLIDSIYWVVGDGQYSAFHTFPNGKMEKEKSLSSIPSYWNNRKCFKGSP